MSKRKWDVANEFCDRLGIEGSSSNERCKILIRAIKKKPATLKKPDLEKLAKDIGVSTSGTKKQITSRIEKAIKEETTKSPNAPIVMPQQIADMVVAQSVKKNITEEVTDSCVVYLDRHLTTVTIPKYAFNNKGTWIPVATNCKVLGFYLSTGTSNEGKNFPGIWFPFLRIKTGVKKYSYDMDRGWIWKANGLQRNRTFLELLEKIMPISDFLLVFFEKFSHFWQVQMSAALPSAPRSKWNTHRELIELRAFCLTHRYLPFEGFIEDDSIVTEYEVKRCERVLREPEQVNNWLISRRALCADDRGFPP